MLRALLKSLGGGVVVMCKGDEVVAEEERWPFEDATR